MFQGVQELVDYRKKAEVILVVPNVLGSINHALLTLDVLKRNDIKVKEVISQCVHLIGLVQKVAKVGFLFSNKC